MKVSKLRKVLNAAAATQEKLGNMDVAQALFELESLLKEKDKQEVSALVDELAELRRTLHQN